MYIHTSYNIVCALKSVCAFAPTEPTGCEVGRVGVVCVSARIPRSDCYVYAMSMLICSRAR